MNRRNKFITAATFILVTSICSASITIAALADNNRLSVSPDSSLSIEESVELTNKLEKKDFSQLVSETDKLDINKNNDVFGCYYDAIKTKLHDTSVKDITSEILNKKINDETKINLILLCETENIKIDYEDLVPMLKDEKVSSNVKGVLVDLLAAENDSYADTIEEYAKSCDSSELMRALQSLASVRPSEAEKIANDILSDLTDTFSSRYKAALVSKSVILENGGSSEAINNFIDTCDYILKNMQADDTDEKEISVIYSLSALKDKKSFSYLMNLNTENAVDFRAYIVDENENVINSILDSAPDAESVSLIARTIMYYVPQAEFKEKINEYLNKNSDYFDKNTEQKEILLEVIK